MTQAHKQISIFNIFLLLLLFISCKKDKIENIDFNSLKNTSVNEDGMIIIGNKLENPYKLSNMQAAYNLIKDENNLPNLNLIASHLYIRFLPKELEEYNELIYGNQELIFFDYPLDYEIIKEGSYYIDPTLISENYTWQYTVVPANFNFSNTEYEILEEAFIPDESTFFNNNADPLSDEVLDLLFLKANEITGNFDVFNSSKTGKTNASWWTPKANVQVVDGDGQLRPNSPCHKLANNGNTYLEGIAVRTHRFLKLAKGVTNNYGNATMNKQYKGKVRYNIQFKTDKFRLALMHPMIPKTLVGPNQTGDWNPVFNMNTSTLDTRSAMAFMAAYDFIHRDNVRGPIKNPYSGHPLIPTTIVIDNVLTAGVASHAMLATNATVFRYTANESTKRAYTVTIHELGHLSHKIGSPLNYNLFINNYGIIRNEMAVGESWAEGVEWFIANNKYLFTDFNGFNQQNNIHQTLNNGNLQVETYTQLVRNLVDSFNENFILYDKVDFREIVLPNESSYLVENNAVYYTPVAGNNPCPLQGTFLQGQNCFITNLPEVNSYIITGSENNIIEVRIPNPTSDRPFDPVSGYTMAEIQTALFQSNTWHGWRNKLEQNTNKPDEKFLEVLFNNWFQN